MDTDPVDMLNVVVQQAKAWRHVVIAVTAVRRIDESDGATFDRVLAEYKSLYSVLCQSGGAVMMGPLPTGPRLPPLTDEEADLMLARLAVHFNEPVMPVSQYCEKLRLWERAINMRVERTQLALYPGMDSPMSTEDGQKVWSLYQQETGNVAALDADRSIAVQAMIADEHFAESITNVFQQITKSALLARLIYGGEDLREIMCPDHKGSWSGRAWADESKGEKACGCNTDGNVTGWLPNPPRHFTVNGKLVTVRRSTVTHSDILRFAFGRTVNVYQVVQITWTAGSTHGHLANGEDVELRPGMEFETDPPGALVVEATRAVREGDIP